MPIPTEPYVSATRSILIGVPDMEESIHLYRDIMGCDLEWRGQASRSMLDAWGIPQTATAEIVELSARQYPYGRLRLAAFSGLDSEIIRDDFGSDAVDSPLDIGPKAIDFYVADPINAAFQKLLDAGLPSRSVPREHKIGETISEEVLFTAPGNLPILIMVGVQHSELSLRPGSPEGDFSEIATASVVCGDLEDSRKFYGDVLGLKAVNDAETGDEFRDLVAELLDAPKGTRVHFLLYAEDGEASGKILLLHFFDAAQQRLTGRMRPGNLGFSLFSHETNDIEALYDRTKAAGYDVVTPPTIVESPQGGTVRMMMVKGPNEEMFEFFQS